MPHRRIPEKTSGKSKISSPAKPVNGGKGSNGEEPVDPVLDHGIAKILTKLASMETKFDAKFEGLKSEVREGQKSIEFKIAEIDDKVKKSRK